MPIDGALLRHPYGYDRTLPLVATSEVKPTLDPIVSTPLTSHVPKLIVNGTEDELITLEGGQRRQAAFAEPKSFHWSDGGHAESPAQLIEAARQFLAATLA